MLVRCGDAIVISTVFNDSVITLEESKEWSIWLKRVRALSRSTISSFMKSMDRFWIWTLYNHIGLEETFPLYQGRYREALREGFEIVRKVIDEQEGEYEIPIFNSAPLKKVTINKELAGINSYFYFIDESKLIEDHRFINILHERHKNAHSFLAGIDIKKSPLALAHSGARLKYLPPYKITKSRQRIKYFPPELFDHLLSLAKPRERLLYLLLGGTSARIGQALNLTLYDIDYSKKEVWLLDPKSDDEDIFGNKRIQWLREEYDIDPEGENEHNTADLQFKYPIPLYYEPLYWLSDKYQDMFFETLEKYSKSDAYVSEFVRFPRHPFFFVTKTGKRVHSRDAYGRLKATLRKLYVYYGADEYPDLLDLGLHSLRHMYGHARAELYARVGNDSIPYITMNQMGHSNFESTLVYFNLSRETVKEMIEMYLRKD